MVCQWLGGLAGEGTLHQAGHRPAIRMASELCLDLRAREGQSGKITALAVI